MARRRPRGAGKREFLKDIRETEVSQLYSTISGLLQRLYVPLVRAYPFGPITERHVEETTYSIMMEAGTQFRKLQKTLRCTPPEVRKVIMGDNTHDSKDTKTTMSVAVWLQTDALVSAHPPLEVESIGDGTTESRVAVTKRAAPCKMYTRRYLPGHGTLLLEHDDRGEVQQYTAHNGLVLSRVLTGRIDEGCVEQKGIFSFLAPFHIPRGEELFYSTLWTGGGLPPASSFPPHIGGEGPASEQAMWLLPGNPYYEQIKLWAETAYVMQALIRQHLNVYTFLQTNCATVGQLRRMWPEVVTFAPPSVASKLRGSKTSPMPQNLRPFVSGANFESNEAYRRRMTGIHRQIVELTEACTRAVLLPDPTTEEQRFINGFRTDGYYTTLPAPETCVWNM